ncbi:hypothetical protein C8Q80DRAFT_391356 [Daedaleopsis nitida]|nr:hypothetical protein C8Q80DRAFT_391356 [Daedaleopsis nitida]
MHRTLLISEIADFICEPLDERTLASLARSCKALHESAIRSLWADLNNLVPLVRCFPSDCWMIEENELILQRLPRAHEWTAFERYARLVRTLGIYPAHGHAYTRLNLSFDVLPSLCGVRPQGAALPNLRSFKWSSLGLSAQHLPAFAYLLGSNVKQMFINAADLASNTGHILTLFFAILAQRRTSLNYIGFFNLPNLHSQSPAASLALSYTVQGAPNLTTFDCAHIAVDEDAVNALATLSTLTHCSLRLPELRTWRTTGTISHPFPALRHIEISCSVEAYSAFSRAMTLPFMKHAVLAITSIPDNKSLLDFIPSIRRQLSPSSLTSVQVHLFDGLRLQITREAVAAHGAILRSAHFTPLFDFSLLESFDLRLPCMHDIDDSLFASLAKAWPRLRTFVLGDQPYCVHESPRATLKALVPFATHCLHLEAIGMQLDASSSTQSQGQGLGFRDDLRALPAQGSLSRVSLLHVSTSPVANAEDVATFLSCVFPELRIVWTSRSDKTREGQKRRRGWQKVDKLVRLMQQVRLDERRRWQVATPLTETYAQRGNDASVSSLPEEDKTGSEHFVLSGGTR